jgi:hypothetical protein
VRRLAKEHRPKLIQCGTTAYSRTLDFDAFRAIADEVGALLFADIAHIAGLWWRPACTRARSATPSSSPPPRTRRCAGRAAG